MRKQNPDSACVRVIPTLKICFTFYQEDSCGHWKSFLILQSVIESELLDNLKVYDFELSSDEMAIIDTLNKNLRKIIPVNKLKSGETVFRDAKSRHYPFNYREPME